MVKSIHCMNYGRNAQLLHCNLSACGIFESLYQKHIRKYSLLKFLLY